ncbi:MAG TPA: nitroreductase [Chromatiaceae bacterium]|nr:nitroreductase [Chromatiaceae bacterium]
MNVEEAIVGRYSCRAYLDRPVPREVLEKVIDTARWSPSGANIQPWQVAVVQGETRKRLSERLIETFDRGVKPVPDYQYYPREWPEPYRERRFQCGMALYQALGIERDDKARRLEAWKDNYRFFGAPVALFFFLDRVMEQGSWLDMGMFIQAVMLAAREQGLETCPQASTADYPDVVREILELDDSHLLLCGMAMGYSDPGQPVNNYRTDREPVEGFTRWFD